jgi:nitroreductase
MEFYDVISGRESIRNYDPDRLVDRATLNRILEAGRIAPSAANFQPWKFLLISSQEVLAKVRQCYPRTWFMDAPYVLIVTGDKNLAWKRADGYNSIETDLAIAMAHLMLAAENEGVGTCWIANFDYQHLRRALQLTESERLYAITPLGYPRQGFVKKGAKNRKPFDEVVKFL